MKLSDMKLAIQEIENLNDELKRIKDRLDADLPAPIVLICDVWCSLSSTEATHILQREYDKKKKDRAELMGKIHAQDDDHDGQ